MNVKEQISHLILFHRRMKMTFIVHSNFKCVYFITLYNLEWVFETEFWITIMQILEWCSLSSAQKKWASFKLLLLGGEEELQSFSGAFTKETSFIMFILFYIHSSNSVKQRPDLFYLQPEASCHPSSPVWYSAQALDSTMMESMLTRILAIRDIHLDSKHQQKYLDSSDEESS